MKKPRILDLFCGAGGAAKGYHDAGFDVVGVDHRPQPHHKYGEFIQADALELDDDFVRSFDAIHASPPCQKFSSATPVWKKKHHVDLIPATRELCKRSGKFYVIENVVGSPVHKSIMLCGTMFPPLRVLRHRHFEMNFLVPQPHCKKPHPKTFWYRSKRKQRKRAVMNQYEVFITVAGSNARIDNMRDAMGIDWMTKAEIVQAVPPAYTEYIGRYLLAYVKEEWV